MRTHYEVMGVKPNATQQEIEEVADALALMYEGGDPRTVNQFAERHKELETAYITLADTEKRAEYDRHLAEHDGQEESAVSLSKSHDLVKNKSTHNSATYLAIAFVATFVIYQLVGPKNPRELAQYEALTMCQSTIKYTAIDPDMTDVPYVNAVEPSIGDYLFIWNSSSHYARMRNGLGLEVPVTALCKVDIATKRIVTLLVGSQQIIGGFLDHR